MEVKKIRNPGTVPVPVPERFPLPIKYDDYRRFWGPAGKETLGTVVRTGFFQKFISPDETHAIVVKKYIDPFKSVQSAENALREIELLQVVIHKNIVQLLDLYKVEECPDIDFSKDEREEQGSIYHITEYCGERLSRKIKEGQHSIDSVKNWIRDLLGAVTYLQSSDVCHRDLRPDNICVDSTGKLTLLDLGMSLIYKPRENTNAYMPIEELVQLRGVRLLKDEHGRFYEINKRVDSKYDKVDIWSASIILCEMVAGRVLFEGENLLCEQMKLCGKIEESLLEQFESDEIRSQLRRYSNTVTRQNMLEVLLSKLEPGRGISIRNFSANDRITLSDFLERTLQFSPAKRLTAKDALNHPFLSTATSNQREEAMDTSLDCKETLDSYKQRITDMIKAFPIGY